MRDALLVAIGAVPGAWLRFRVVNHLEPMLPRKHWGTCTVNVIACFVLGLVAALVSRCGPDQRLGLLLATGFLGSLSTSIGESTGTLAKTGAWRSGEACRHPLVVLKKGSLAHRRRISACRRSPPPAGRATGANSAKAKMAPQRNLA